MRSAFIRSLARDVKVTVIVVNTYVTSRLAVGIFPGRTVCFRWLVCSIWSYIWRHFNAYLRIIDNIVGNCMHQFIQNYLLMLLKNKDIKKQVGINFINYGTWLFCIQNLWLLALLTYNSISNVFRILHVLLWITKSIAINENNEIMMRWKRHT